MHPDDLIGEEFDITYKNVSGKVREFSIEVTDAWVEDGFAYIEATNLDTDFDLTFRLDRVLDGIPDIQQYLPKSKRRIGKLAWFVIALFVLGMALALF